jgi:hypothetical protein
MCGKRFGSQVAVNQMQRPKAQPLAWAEQGENTMKFGQKTLTLTAMAALSVGALFAQGTVPKATNPSNQPMVSKMAEDKTESQSNKKKVDKHVHKHHHKKANKQPSSTPTQGTTTNK